MKKPVAIVEENQRAANLLRNEVSKDTGMDLDVRLSRGRKKIGKGALAPSIGFKPLALPLPQTPLFPLPQFQALQIQPLQPWVPQP